MACTDIFIKLGNNTDIKKDESQTLSGKKKTYLLDGIVQEPGNRVLSYLQGGSNRPFVREELMHVSEDTQAPPDRVSEWKEPCLIL